VAEDQFPELMLDVEYLTSYEAAVPLLPSSPGAVQLRVIELDVGLLVVRLVTAAGGVVSVALGGVVKEVVASAQSPPAQLIAQQR
jgi:hypothetical protein